MAFRQLNVLYLGSSSLRSPVSTRFMSSFVVPCPRISLVFSCSDAAKFDPFWIFSRNPLKRDLELGWLRFLGLKQDQLLFGLPVESFSIWDSSRRALCPAEQIRRYLNFLQFSLSLLPLIRFDSVIYLLNDQSSLIHSVFDDYFVRCRFFHFS